VAASRGERPSAKKNAAPRSVITPPMNIIVTNRIAVTCLLLSLGLALAGCSSTGATDEHETASSNAENVAVAQQPLSVVWADEFDGTCDSGSGGGTDINGLCKANWYYNSEAHFNNEVQQYDNVNTANTYNTVEVSNGTLKIRAKWIPGISQWRSARLITKNKYEFVHGRVAARIRVPTFPNRSGVWPAFWMLGTNINQAPAPGGASWPQSGAEELDIFETSSAWQPKKITANIIGADGCGDYGCTRNYWPAWPSSCASSDPSVWHNYAVQWDADQLEFFQDGNSVGSAGLPHAGTGNVFQHAMYMLLNVAVGGELGGDPTGMDNQVMEVDWVRHSR